jgi:Uma2 family endonuclease
MEIMSPSGWHEQVKSIVGRLLEIYCFESEIPVRSFGSVTCKRDDLERGIEPDECYYIRSDPGTGATLDLKIHPPPDLAIEVDITRSSIAREPIYAALGVPEIWRFDGKRMTVLRRRADGIYRRAQRSGLLPGLSIAKFNSFLAKALPTGAGPMVETMRLHLVLKAFRDWVRKNSESEG